MNIEDGMHSARIDRSHELLKSFFNLVDEWSIELEDQQNIFGNEALYQIQRNMEENLELVVSDETMSRLVLFTGLKADVDSLFPKKGEGLNFYHSKQPLLGGASPHQVIFGDIDDGLIRVKTLLMQMRNGLQMEASAATVYSE